MNPIPEEDKQGPYLHHFIFFVTYEWAYKVECYITLGR
jgi:hypothetical protein